MLDQAQYQQNTRRSVTEDAPAPRVCHVVASINERTGGPAVSVTNLSRHLKDAHIKPVVFTLDYPNAGPQVRTNDLSVISIPADIMAVRIRGYSPEARNRLLLLAREIDMIHNHGLWMFPNLYSRLAATSVDIPLITSPRGMLEAWSLNHGRWKKRLAWKLYEKRNLASATAFHATSLAEIKSIRACGYTQPIAMIPNGVSIPENPKLFQRTKLESEYPELKSKHWLLFMSRLHPKKGLDLLLECWSELNTRFPDWQLIIAGGDAPGYEGKYRAKAAAAKLSSRVTFTGNLSGHQKSAALACSECFVLPTHSENFGIVIAEALAHATPVITTKGTPWQELQQENCGWWIDNNAQSLTRTMSDAIEMSQTERAAMGARGRELVSRTYGWPEISAKMARFYQWILSGGSKPEFVDEYKL